MSSYATDRAQRKMGRSNRYQLAAAAAMTTGSHTVVVDFDDLTSADSIVEPHVLTLSTRTDQDELCDETNALVAHFPCVWFRHLHLVSRQRNHWCDWSALALHSFVVCHDDLLRYSSTQNEIVPYGHFGFEQGVDMTRRSAV